MLTKPKTYWLPVKLILPVDPEIKTYQEIIKILSKHLDLTLNKIIQKFCLEKPITAIENHYKLAL